jgi:hypothetical protein
LLINNLSGKASAYGTGRIFKNEFEAFRIQDYFHRPFHNILKAYLNHGLEGPKRKDRRHFGSIIAINQISRDKGIEIIYCYAIWPKT